MTVLIFDLLLQELTWILLGPQFHHLLAWCSVFEGRGKFVICLIYPIFTYIYMYVCIYIHSFRAFRIKNYRLYYKIVKLHRPCIIALMLIFFSSNYVKKTLCNNSNYNFYLLLSPNHGSVIRIRISDLLLFYLYKRLVIWFELLNLFPF